MNAIAIHKELKVFTGTTRYYKHLYPGKSPIAITDGCKYVRDELNAHWLFDTILKYQDDPGLKKENFQIWELRRLKKDMSWLLTCKRDIKANPIIRKEIESSDFPIDYIRLWVIGSVVLLPSEY